jgi:hypothetical protein
VGGSIVMLHGFVNAGAAACKFGGSRVRTSSVTSNGQHSSCLSPPGFAGFTTLELVDHLGGTVAPALDFVYVAAASVTAVSPSFAVSGTVLQLYGSSFAHGTATCSVGGGSGEATVVSSVLAVCEAPSAAGWQLLPVAYVASASFHDSSAGASTLPEVPSGAELMYATLPSLEAVRPRRGPARGGSATRVLGRGFANAPGLTCRFGAVPVTAQWISEAEVRCTAPAHTPDKVALQVSLNAGDWSAPLPFLYYC